MIRARFRVADRDFRPMNWPIKHPYWRSGEGEGYSVLIAYADDEKEIMLNWPDATHIDAEPCDTYTFTSRFPCPKWFTPPTQERTS
jgi:hypothetical protein